MLLRGAPTQINSLWVLTAETTEDRAWMDDGRHSLFNTVFSLRKDAGWLVRLK